MANLEFMLALKAKFTVDSWSNCVFTFIPQDQNYQKKHHIGVFLIDYLSSSRLMRQKSSGVLLHFSLHNDHSNRHTLGDFTIKPFLRWLSAGLHRPLYINHSNQPAIISMLWLLTWLVWMLVKDKTFHFPALDWWLPWYVCLCASEGRT